MAMLKHNDLRYFTDRDTQKKAFAALWQDGSLPIVVFTGLSGTGKSTLIDWLIVHQCQAQNRGWVKIDLFTDFERPTFLASLAKLLTADAQKRYKEAATIARQNYKTQKQLLLQAHASRPISATQEAKDHGQIHGAEINIYTGDEKALSALSKIYGDQLTVAFEDEFVDLPTTETVLFLDTYERAQERSSAKQVTWLWQLLLACCEAAPNLRIVVGSRVDLNFDVAQSWRTRSRLDAFSPEDAATFLQAYSQGKMDVALIEAIFTLTQGHPMLTEMGGQLWQEGIDAGKPLTLAELQTGLAHRSAEEWLYGRIINRLEVLGETEVVAACRYGPLLRSFSMASLNAILPADIEPFSDPKFRELTKFAFIKQTERGWAFHELMRGVQLAYLARQEDVAVRACHERAVAYFGTQMEQRERHSDQQNYIYHCCFIDPEVIFAEVLAENFRAQLAGNRVWWDELLQILEKPAQYLRLGDEQRGALKRNRGLWFVHDYKMSEGRTSYAGALELFRAVGDRLGEANTLKAIGDVLNFKKELDDALASYDAALLLFRAVGDRLGEANTLQAIGFFHIDINAVEKGSLELEQALDFYEQIGDRVGLININWGLGVRLVQKENYTDAEPFIETAARTAQEIFPEHPFTAQALSLLADIRKSLANLDN